MALAATLVVAATSLNGCATERHHRHLAVPSRVVDTQAFDRFLPPTLTYASPVQQAQVTSSVVTSPGYVQVPGGPPPASPPPLPVVRVDPKPATPFANGQEPPIRIGRTGRAAPPASQRGREPLSYARIDSRGNL
ncbi:MAG: hypothetical protein QF464_08370, partial [Myxococcota bacterium]|nr:hypothetical protein [Myxococcota bacterium]